MVPYAPSADGVATQNALICFNRWHCRDFVAGSDKY
jgi:hypothetical protein